MVYFVFALVWAFIAAVIARRPSAIVQAYLMGALTSFIFMPVAGFDWWGTWFWIALGIAFSAWLARVIHGSNSNLARDGFVITIGAVLCLQIAPLFLSGAFFHANAYRNLLTVEERDFDSQQVLLDQTQARFVDQVLAKRAAEELLGNDLGLGSRVKIGTMRIQSINGRLWWVGPFQHKSFFKWLVNDTVPGYVMVSASNYSDSRIITDVTMAYGDTGFHFHRKVHRHLYQQGYIFTGLGKATFELDDQGHPFWIVPKLVNKVGFSGKKVDGVLVIDAVSGLISEFGIDDAPEWIDRIQPESLTATRIDDWGKYVLGWWNSWLAQNNVIQPTPGMALVYTADGRAAWYTGLQSAGRSDQGTMGFMLVDTRTGKAEFYRRAGITETAAAKVMEGQVQEKGYTATWPIPYLVNGIPTYISVLKDEAGNPQMVGMVAYNDRTLVAVENTLREALRSYNARLRSAGTATAVGGAVDLHKFEGRIIRYGYESGSDGGITYIVLETVPNKAFAVPVSLGPEVILSEKGDRVRMETLSTDAAVLDAQSFDNLELAFEKGESEEVVEERLFQAREARAMQTLKLEAEGVLRDMKADELREFLEKVRSN